MLHCLAIVRHVVGQFLFPALEDIVRVVQLISSIAHETQEKLNTLYAAVGEPGLGSELDQAGLRDGADIVHDYLSHGEAGVAFEHLLYMIKESHIELSADGYRDLTCAGVILEISPDKWSTIRRATGG